MFDSPEPILRVPAKTEAAEPTRNDKLHLIAKWFDDHGTRRFGPLIDVEKMTPAVLAATKTAGTLFGSFGAALWEGGVKAPEMPTMGAVMNEFTLNQKQVNDIGCYCVHTTGMALGSHVAIAVRNVAGG